MKALIAILAVFVAAAAGAVGGVIVSGSSATPSGEVAAHTGAGNASPAASVSDNAKLVSRIESLNQEVADLHQEVLRLKEATHREPASEAAPVKVAEAETTDFAASHRDAILKIIAQDREDLEHKKEEERKARDLENILARADRAAKKLGLNTTQQKALADVYILEGQKMEEMRNLRGQGDPEAARTAFQEFRDWRTSELTKRLGADLAQQVNESDLAGFRGNGGFGGGGRNGGPGGRGGQGGNGGQPGGGPPGGE
jgi:hypothetical protein